MISFDRFKSVEGTPIYLQILLYVKREAVAGNISDGDQLPSRRMLSALLGINPNTVQKAFKLLEEEGLIESKTGAKSYMTLSKEKIEELKEELISEEIKGITASLKQMAISKKDAIRLIEKYWEVE